MKFRWWWTIFWVLKEIESTLIHVHSISRIHTSWNCGYPQAHVSNDEQHYGTTIWMSLLEVFWKYDLHALIYRIKFKEYTFNIWVPKLIKKIVVQLVQESVERNKIFYGGFSFGSGSRWHSINNRVEYQAGSQKWLPISKWQWSIKFC